MADPKKSEPAIPHKVYIGSDHAPTDEEALEMGRALFDEITAQRVRDRASQGK